VNQLLRKPPKVRCATDLPNIAMVSTWADDVRNEQTGPWHFIDIPRGESAANLDQFCRDRGCVVQAIEEQRKILTNRGAKKQDRMNALMFVIHFAGDLHQPLHTTTNSDRGGNCVPVAYFGKKPREGKNESYSPNLHSVWDTSIIRHVLENEDSVQGLADELDSMFQADRAAFEQGELKDWVAEAHAIAEQTSYGNLEPNIPVETPQEIKECSDNNHVSKRMLALNLKVGDKYQDAAVTELEKQLARAGFRLAKILNDVWPQR